MWVNFLQRLGPTRAGGGLDRRSGDVLEPAISFSHLTIRNSPSGPCAANFRLFNPDQRVVHQLYVLAGKLVCFLRVNFAI